MYKHFSCITARAQTSITARKPSATVAEGSSFTLEWDFSLQSSDSLREIVFGLWEKGYTSSFFITVTQSRGAVVNPELSKKHPSYVGRVFWVGNISRSYAAFRLVNARLSDSKTYGCQLGVGGFGQTRDSKMSLVVEVRDVFKLLRLRFSMSVNQNLCTNSYIDMLRISLWYPF